MKCVGCTDSSIIEFVVWKEDAFDICNIAKNVVTVLGISVNH